jgi:hypothetical protein
VATKTKRAKVKLLKGVRIDGKHVDAGKRIEVDKALANDLVAANQAVLDEDEDRVENDLDSPLGTTQLGVQMENPTHGDPGHVELPPRTAKVVDKRTPPGEKKNY